MPYGFSAHLKGWSFASVTSLFLLGMVLAPPFVSETARFFVTEVFASLCHQLPDRSPHLHDTQLAACHRCLGIFAGFAAGSLASLSLTNYSETLRSYLGTLLIVLGTPALVDWIAGLTPIWTNTPFSRVATGALFGISVGLALAIVAAYAFREREIQAEETNLEGEQAQETADNPKVPL